MAVDTIARGMAASLESYALKYKGTKQTWAELMAVTGQKVGDVWNVNEEHAGSPAGTNWAWDGTQWDPLGGTFSIKIDGSTITTNENDEIQAVGVKETNDGKTTKTWVGTLAEYMAIEEKDENTLYYITDEYPDYESVSNKVNVLSSSSTHTQYPSAKCVYDALQNKQDIMQYASLPAATASNVGTIYQYVGVTDSTYTNGRFYKCISDGATEPTYSWEEIVFGENQYVLEYSDSNEKKLATLNAWLSEYITTGKQPQLMWEQNGIRNIFQSIQGNINESYDWYFITYSYSSNLSSQINKHVLQISYNKVNKQFTNYYEQGGGAPYPIYCYKSFTVGGPTALATDNTASFTPTDNYNPATKKYVDDAKIQKAELPTATSALEGVIYQYTGTTTSTFTNGRFYKCVSDGAAEPTYSWEEVGFGGKEYPIYELITNGGFDRTYNFNAEERLNIQNIIQDASDNNYKIINLLFCVSLNTATPLVLTSDDGIYRKNNYMDFIGIWAPYTEGRLHKYKIRVGGSWSNGVFTCTSATCESKESNYLEYNNTTSFTPTGDYNPATKKYVDDSLSNIPSIGDLDDLTTTVKTDLVAAINEVNAKIGDINEALSRLVIIPEEEQALEDLANLVDLPEEEE